MSNTEIRYFKYILKSFFETNSWRLYTASLLDLNFFQSTDEFMFIISYYCEVAFYKLVGRCVTNVWSIRHI